MKKRSPLAELRRLYPNEHWKAVRTGFGWDYEGDNEAFAGWRSCLAPTHPADDESCVSRFFIYRKDQTPEELFI